MIQLIVRGEIPRMFVLLDEGEVALVEIQGRWHRADGGGEIPPGLTPAIAQTLEAHSRAVKSGIKQGIYEHGLE